MPPKICICLGMICEIVCVLHDPLALFGLLPVMDAEPSYDFGIVYIAHIELMEIDLQADVVSGSLGCVNSATMGNTVAMTSAQARAMS